METNQTDLMGFLSDIKAFRKEIDASIVKAESYLKTLTPYGREMSLVRTKLQEAKMWAGKILEVMGSPFPPELADKSN